MYYRDTEHWTSYGSLQGCNKDEAHYVDISSYEELEQRNNELAAQVEHYKELARDYTQLAAKGIYYTLEELFEHDAEIAKAAFINGVNYAHKRPDVILHKVIEMVACDYVAEQLRL